MTCWLRNRACSCGRYVSVVATLAKYCCIIDFTIVVIGVFAIAMNIL